MIAVGNWDELVYIWLRIGVCFTNEIPLTICDPKNWNGITDSSKECACVYLLDGGKRSTSGENLKLHTENLSKVERYVWSWSE